MDKMSFLVGKFRIQSELESQPGNDLRFRTTTDTDSNVSFFIEFLLAIGCVLYREIKFEDQYKTYQITINRDLTEKTIDIISELYMSRAISNECSLAKVISQNSSSNLQKKISIWLNSKGLIDSFDLHRGSLFTTFTYNK